ncbi:unnamed protein product, partial [Didymodactylos carnosus]
MNPNQNNGHGQGNQNPQQGQPGENALQVT